MNIKILIFGIAKDLMGGASTGITVEEGTTVQQFRALLEKQYPRLAQLSSYMIALNNEYASGNEIINERDEIAIIPPVSGG